MEKTDEDVIINTKRKISRPFFSYFVIGLFLITGYFIWREIGAIIGIIIGIILNMIFCSFRGVKLWKLCERDYYHLVSKGYSSKNALLVISKSFNSFLSDSFHKRVIEKFPTLDEVVVFFTGALPENTGDEDWAIECLEKTIIKRTADGGYKARTKW